LAGEEARADFPALAVQLLSSTAAADLGRFNPHLGAGRRAELLELLALIMLRTSRRAFLASAITSARALRAELVELQEHGAHQSEAQVSLYKRFVFSKDFVHERSIPFSPFAICIAQIVARLLHDDCAIYDPPPTTFLCHTIQKWLG